MKSSNACLRDCKPSDRHVVGEQIEKMLQAFHFNLTALSYIALLVGLFLIYNTISVSVISRREEIGILRALGVARRTSCRAVPGRGGGLGGGRDSRWTAAGTPDGSWVPCA